MKKMVTFIFFLVILWGLRAQESQVVQVAQTSGVSAQAGAEEPTIAQVLQAGQARVDKVADNKAPVDSDDVDEEAVEPIMTIGAECIYPGTFICRCGDTSMGCLAKERCLGYCSHE